jgi:hypothetical protein
MAPASTATREAPAAPNDRAHAPAPRSTHGTTHGTTHNTGRPIPARPSRTATDDEILGLDAAARNAGATQTAPENDDTWREDASTSSSSSSKDRQHDGDVAQTAEPEALRATLDANPELRRAWDDAQAYRETFATPEAARNATALLADLDRMDALFFSRRPEDHAELARTVASLDPAAFTSLAQAMAGLATGSTNATTETFPVGAQQEGLPSRRLVEPGRSGVPGADAWQSAAQPATPPADSRTAGATQPTAAQTEFFHAANAAAVEGVLDAIQSQVERLLPEGVSKSARNRVVGEIYRELDTTLRSNRQLGQQMRDAFRSGALDAEHQRALVSLVTGRARQALPGVAKRVLNEWTSTVVAANQDRRTRQRAAEHRVDIAGSGGTGSDGPRSMTPREIDYKRMSDSDILNL